MKKTKILLSVILVCILVLTGCGKKDKKKDNPPDNPNNNAVSGDKLNITETHTGSYFEN